MKLKNKIIVSLGLLTGAVSVGMTLIDDVVLKDVVLPVNFTVTAHTGCEKTKDNSLDAITLGYGCGADIVEFDLYFDKNGKAVLSHNEPHGNEPSVEEAFKLISGYKGLRVNIDVKKTDDMKQVASLAEKYGIKDRIFYTGITADDVEAVSSSTPEIMYYLNKKIDIIRKNDEAYIRQLIDEVRASGACGLNINHKGLSSVMVELFHNEGLEVSVWTVNNRIEMISALSKKCDNITTRRPEELKKLVDRLRGRI